MNYIKKSKKALLEAEKKIADGEDPTHWLTLATKWQDLANVNLQEIKIPPALNPRMPYPKQDFRFGLYL